MALFQPYLTLNDYLPIIQAEHLEQVLATKVKKESAENHALALIRSYLSSQYDLDREFTPTLPYDIAKTYYAGDRVTFDFDAWVSGTTYEVDSMMGKGGIAYMCLIANSDTVFDAGKWNKIGNTTDMYYVPYPYPVFQLNIQQQTDSNVPGYYKRGDIVWYKNKIYTALQDSIVLSRAATVQYVEYKDLPYPNVFPDSTYGAQYWKDDGAYTVEAGISPVGSPWVLGDNRDPIILSAAVSITIYRACLSVSANAVPIARKTDYDETIYRLKCISSGEMTTDIVEKQPERSQSIWWTSRTKKRNSYP
jgi:hypothetical protein